MLEKSELMGQIKGKRNKGKQLIADLDGGKGLRRNTRKTWVTRAGKLWKAINAHVPRRHGI